MTRLRSRLLARAVALVFLFLRPALAASPNYCQPAPSSPQAATEYFVSLADAPRNIAHVAIVLRRGEVTRTLDMPVWNALYQVRDFATNVMNVRAQDASGTPAQVRNTKPSGWQIAAPAGCVTVSYDIYLDTRGPFGSQLTADYGFLNWAMVLMYSPELRSQPVSLRLQDVPPDLGGARPACPRRCCARQGQSGGCNRSQLRRTGRQPGRDGSSPGVLVPAGRCDLPHCGRCQSFRLRYVATGQDAGENYPCRRRLDAGPPV